MGFLHVQNPHLEQTVSAGLQEGPVLLTCPAHSVSEAQAPLQILQLQNLRPVPQALQGSMVCLEQPGFLHVQNVRLAQRAPGEHWALPGK